MRSKKKVNRRGFLTLITTATAGILVLPEKIIGGKGNNLHRNMLNIKAAEKSGVDRAILKLSEPEDQVSFTTDGIIFSISPTTGAFHITDQLTNTVWNSNPFRNCFAEAVLTSDGQSMPVILSQCKVRQQNNSLLLFFHPLPSRPLASLKITINNGIVGNSLNFSYEADPGLEVEKIRLFDNAMWTTDKEEGYAVIPVREGLLIPADANLSYSQSFDTYGYEGCHMAMMGIVKKKATALLTWSDPNTTVEIKSHQFKSGEDNAIQILSTSVILSKTSRSVQVQFCGNGDYSTIARAYKDTPQSGKWRVPWSEKFRQHPEDSRLVGACNIKLWETLSRTMDETSSEELSKSVNWTFDEAAQVAEHMKNDLKIDNCLFIIGGWINRGYDNRHPDIMPPAPECGGEAALADCSHRIMNLGYLFCLHDNYQDIYHDSPSWNEDYIMKKQNGSLAVGGRWSGGTAYLTCSKKALELAQRPQNLPAVKKLTAANAYLTDTTFAAGLYECFDHNHPLTRSDDIYWKQKMADYARATFGVYGSEDGREWGLPHGDFFEGTTGASGKSFHELEFKSKLGGFVVPLFEIIYRDGIAAFGKYDYKWEEAAEYVLQHIIFGRTLNYHNIPPHLYWKDCSDYTSPGTTEMADKALFVRGDDGWTEGLHPTDRFIKNTQEVLGPLNTITFQMPLTEHRFLGPDRKIQQSTFGHGEEAVIATVNMSDSVYSHTSQLKETILLPQYGFLIESTTFIAFHALNWNGMQYETPPLFTVRSFDDKPMNRCAHVRVFHGFGDNRIKIRESILTVKSEEEFKLTKGTQ